MFRTNESTHQIKASNNQENNHLGAHWPMLAGLKELAFYLAFTSDDLKQQAIEYFNEGLDKAQQKLTEI